MKETGLQGKTCVVPVAVVAVLGMAGMGLVSVGVANADITTITDTLTIGVAETCTFRDTSSETFTGSALNGNEVENFNNSGVHTFYLFCNNNNGYEVSATPHDLKTTGGIQEVIAYTSQYEPSGKNGLWTAEITTNEPNVTVTNPVPVGGGVIISSSTHSSATMSFTATYSAYVGTETPAGTYSGTIVYKLSALSGTSNSGNDGGGTADTNTNNDNTNENSDSNNSDNTNAPNSDTDKPNKNTDSSGGAGTNSVPSAAPLATNLNNTYSTYNTTNSYNTYNTTSYGGSGVVPAATNIAPTTTSNETDGVTSGDGAEGSSNASGVGVGSGYEKPLGVTSTTSSSSTKDSEVMDPMPIVATGALAAAGIAALALARSSRKENEKE